MAPSPSAEPPVEQLGPPDAELLLDVAEAAIAAGVAGAAHETPTLDAPPPGLRSRRGAFVTLTVAGELNGCIGRVEGDESLVVAVARLARAAAFADPRLPALRALDLPHLTIELSVLSPLAAVDAADRPGLIRALRPGLDGVVVGGAGARGLFLPTVWEQLPDPEDFLDALWGKAGWPPGTWPADLRAHRFTTERFHRHPTPHRRGVPG
jgi:AmmeMemoRadiSam system protein A